MATKINSYTLYGKVTGLYYCFTFSFIRCYQISMESLEQAIIRCCYKHLGACKIASYGCQSVSWGIFQYCRFTVVQYMNSV